MSLRGWLGKTLTVSNSGPSEEGCMGAAAILLTHPFNGASVCSTLVMGHLCCYMYSVSQKDGTAPSGSGGGRDISVDNQIPQTLKQV